MKSNFAFLATDFPILYKYGLLAEQYLYSDPNTCLYKLGKMGEAIINLMYQYDNIEYPEPNKAVSRINKLRRYDLLDDALATLFHKLRKIRNDAVHEDEDSIEICKSYLPVAHSISAWFQEVYGQNGDFDASQAGFVMPQPQKVSQPNPVAENDIEEKLMEEATSKARKTKAVATGERQKRIVKAAYARRKYEVETRLLIDEQLRQVGWEADSQLLRYSKGIRPAKGRNLAIAEWPTRSKTGQNGYADYALFIGLKLVAIVEAKAAHKDVSTVIDFQGKQYPREIRSEDEKYLLGHWGEYKVPFSFATNGRPYLEQLKTKSGIWFLDLRKSSNIPKPLKGWISPVGFQDLLAKDVEAGNTALQHMSQDVLRDPDGLNLRYYQIEAIMAAEQAVISGANTCLLAMATGTGKTRTVLGMIYRFLKTNRFQRILFLVDRNSLGVQAHDVFKDVKLEELMSLDKIYNIKGLEDKLVDKETRVQVATVQGMIQRILYNNDEQKPAVSDFDLIIVDEAHRGYTLDKLMAEEELAFRDQRDFQSKYRSVIEYFDCVKIALTATPAIHTTQIFGQPVYTYSYREAVIDGYLVDHDVPHNIKTQLSQQGIKYHKGDSAAVYDPVTGLITNIDNLEDELNFDIDDFNRQVISESFNQAVLEEICQDIDPTDEGAGKTLIYAVNDHHADMIVNILKNIYQSYDVDNSAIQKITGSIENGNQKKIQEAIKRFKNEAYPNIVVTVDLLTTGIDVPEITKLVFLRRVKSRILFEQMLGRATRLCPAIKKDHFDIYDAVQIYDAITSNMKPVTSNPAKKKLLEDREIFVELEKKSGPAYTRPIIVDNHADKITEHTRNYGTGKRPEDYIEEFASFIKGNMNQIAALQIICTRPADLTRESLKELRLLLDRNGFTLPQLNTAVSQTSNEEIVADIISLVRRYAIGSTLLSHEEKVAQAIKRLKKNHKFTAMQEGWIKMIGDYLQHEPVLNKAVFDQDSRFRQKGGFKRIDKMLNNQLESIIRDLNDYMYDDNGGKFA